MVAEVSYRAGYNNRPVGEEKVLSWLSKFSSGARRSKSERALAMTSHDGQPQGNAWSTAVVEGMQRPYF